MLAPKSTKETVPLNPAVRTASQPVYPAGSRRQIGNQATLRRLTHRAGSLAAHDGGAGRDQAALQTAMRGTSDTGGSLPHHDLIQRSFGMHDVSGIRVHTGPRAAEACHALDARAYALGDNIALAEATLFNAAHEAAHVVQHRADRGSAVAGNAVGETGDVYERHADAVAEAVVGDRSAQQLLDAAPANGSAPPVQRQEGGATGVSPENAADAKKKEGTSSDLDTILAAGKRERDAPAPSASTMINGASIVYRILSVFFPELNARWSISGVGGSATAKGISLVRSGDKGVAVTVGRDFILQTDEAHLQDRVDDVGRAFAALEADKTKTNATADTTNTPSVDMAKAIEEGGKLFADKAGFGLTAGTRAGPDANDGYDTRYWNEENRSIVSTVEPWLAMSMLVQHLGDPVPMKSGVMTHWHFDCFEGMDVVRKYAEWRTSTRSAFNQKFNPLRIGWTAYLREGAVDLDKPIRSDTPGAKPYTEGPMVETTKGGVMNFEPQRVPAGPSMDKVLEDAPTASWVAFTNIDVTARLLKHSKDVAAGKPISSDEQALIDRITPWEHENALKISHDHYSAFPFGVVNAAAILDGMSKIVFDPNPVPAGYITRNIYVSTVADKK
jgi:hypothetical protein